jgi:hypothetical protein
MRKLFTLFVALLTLVVVAGCNGNTTVAPTTQAPTTEEPREFAADGEFTAYLVGVHSNAPMVTTVTVTIENDEITGYFIDCIQGKRTQNEETLVYSFNFNASSKKNLGFEYKMHWGAYSATDDTPTIEEYQTWLTANNKKEWHQQAELIEAYWLANGFDSVTSNTETTVIDNVAGVTIKDGGYTDLAAEAVQLAKDGKMQAIYTSSDDLYIATMTVNAEGEFSDLLIDVLQGTPDTAAGTFAWREETKQELGFEYKMHYGTYSATDDTPTIEEYETWLEANDKLEWFQQVALITDYVTENGWNENLAALNDRGGTLDGTTPVDSLAGVTVRSQGYYTLLADLFDCLPE